MKQILHFGVGHGMAELARDVFWFEHRFDWALNFLECFEGLNKEYVVSILKGEALLNPINQGREVEPVFKRDDEFRERLEEHIGIAKQKVEKLAKDMHNLQGIADKLKYGFLSMGGPSETSEKIASQIYKAKTEKEELERTIKYYNLYFSKDVTPELTRNIGGIEIPKALLDEYAEEVVKRLRMAIKMPGYMKFEDPIEMYKLEQRRKELHDRIIKVAGFTSRKEDAYFKFSGALEKYLEEKGAGLA